MHSLSNFCENSFTVIERREIQLTILMFLVLHSTGLERIAEELMGRRKWKLYQEVLVRSHSNSNTTVATANQINNITETGN